MKIGKLRHYVNVESKSQTGTGDRGQPTYTWVTSSSNIPAAIESLHGKKLEIARQLVPTATHRISIRYLSTLTVQDRISWDGHTYNIGFIDNIDQRNRYQELLCEEEI